ncbi:MAG: hypothetical protein IJS01_08040 [Lentisphaeria bacterium]|nr:hypothetical protein [Lentisphaeria bacterium]
MTDRQKSVRGPGFEFSLFARGKNAAQLLLNGAPRLLIGRVTLEEKFSETGALEKKLRRHEAADLLSIGLEGMNVLPFGCEYAVSREFEISDGFADLSGDVAALHFGRVGSLDLEPLTFPENPCSVRFLTAGGEGFREEKLTKDKELYTGPLPLLVITVSWPGGESVEYAVGTDLWRHCAAGRIPDASSEFTLLFRGGELIYERRVLIYGKEAVPEKRPWRFKNLIAWRSGDAPEDAPVEAETFSVPGCQVNPAARREVRRRVRCASGSLVMTGASPCLCDDASHVERPGRDGFRHFDLAEYVSFRLWANRHLMKSGGSLTVRIDENNLFHDTVAARNLRRIPRRLEPEEGEENV